jgi:hypothetical protein
MEYNHILRLSFYPCDHVRVRDHVRVHDHGLLSSNNVTNVRLVVPFSCLCVHEHAHALPFSTK